MPPCPVKAAWLMPIVVYRWAGDRFVFERMCTYVLVQETVPFISMGNMEALRALQAECEAKLRRCPFLLLWRGTVCRAVSLEEGVEEFDEGDHPILEARSAVADDTVLVDFQSTVTVFEWTATRHVLAEHGRIHCSTMMMPVQMREDDLPRLRDRRRGHMHKQVSNSLLVLTDGLVVSLYDVAAFQHRQTLICNPI